MMLELRAVDLAYGGELALRSVDLELGEGEQVCLIGPSGSGKSSLLGLLNGRLAASEGEVVMRGVDFGSLRGGALKEVRKKIAWVPQDLGLVPSLRVSQNVVCGRAARKGFWGLLKSLVWMSRAEREEVYGLLERVGIAEKIFSRVDQLSGGQQQRVALARALYQEPELILADEPVSAVDPERARSVVKLLTELAREEGQTLVMSLHDVGLARRYFDRVIGLRGGRVVFDGMPDDEGVDELYRLEE